MNDTVQPVPPPALHLNRILVPVDFSDLSRFAFEYALGLARSFTADIRLLFVIEPPAYPEWGYAHLVRRDNELKRLGTEKLQTMLAGCGADQRGRVSTEIRCGDATLEITEAAGDWRADVLLMATHGDSGLLHTLLGGTAEQVVRHAPCPVWTVRKADFQADSAAPAFRLKRILLPTDFSEESRKAARYAGALAGRFDAAITLTHVVPAVLPADVNELTHLLEEDALLESARAELRRWKEREFGAERPMDTTVRGGSPFLELADEAKRIGADLTVITTHGHSGLRRFLLGSTAERIVRHAPGPVLVVREKEREFVG